MNKQNFDVNKLRVASPCHIGWENMTGDERVRLCKTCNLNVYNIAEMTSDEARRLITKRDERICLRLYRRVDGTLITRDCPVGLRGFRKRAARRLGAALATIIGLFSIGFGQTNSKKHKKSKPVQIETTITRTATQTGQNNLKATVKDIQGAVIPNAKITLTNQENKQSFVTQTDENGDALFATLPAGVYSIEIVSLGFGNSRVENFLVKENEASQLEIVLEPTETIVVGIFLQEPLIDITSSGITTKITREMMERLPH